MSEETPNGSIFSHFESIGPNCEFGFVQRQAGVRISSLLCWAMVTNPIKLVQLISSDFQNIFEYDNIYPFHGTMIIDIFSEIAWHTEMRSKMIDDSAGWGMKNLEFITSEDDRQTIYVNERSKAMYLRDKVNASLRRGDRIFVCTNAIQNITVDSVKKISSSIQGKGPGHLLFVRQADEENPSGSVRILADGLMEARIARFAPGDRAFDVDFENWTTVCTEAWKLAQEGAW